MKTEDFTMNDAVKIVAQANEAVKLIRDNLDTERSVAITAGFSDVLAAQGGVRPAEVLVALADTFNSLHNHVDEDLFLVMLQALKQIATELRSVNRMMSDPMEMLNKIFGEMFGAPFEPCSADCTCVD